MIYFDKEDRLSFRIKFNDKGIEDLINVLEIVMNIGVTNVDTENLLKLNFVKIEENSCIRSLKKIMLIYVYPMKISNF
ncbi:hypothetical protein R9X47_28680 [Wukongibacter baidiensis]|uniref:hypothetical protein n=1 Tax=Wukongibacter baidiensis TaxID=1723361 RepID=UPI003D7FBA61